MADDRDRHYSSRSIQTLDNAILACENSAKRLVLFAKKAGLLARFSCLDEAKKLVIELRSENPDFDPQLSAWIMFAEGMILHYETLDNAKSKDKFNRAFLVSQMAGDRELAGASAAWLAHCALIAGNMREVVSHISTAFKWSDEDSSEARGRASMVLADSLNWAGLPELARNWYREARKHAVRDGDIALQNVVLYNSATFGVSHITLSDCLSEVRAEDCKRTAMEVASAANLNAALSIESLSSLIPIMQAELLIVQRKWNDAASLLDKNIEIFVKEGQVRLLPRILAQRAWARANLGDNTGAMDDIGSAAERGASCTDLDDKVVMHSRISAAAGILNEEALKNTHSSIAAACLQDFERQQAELQEVLRNLLAEIRN
jgi:tetratricopeptide (TPR) repeat protein